MKYKDYIKAGNEVIYIPTNNSLLTDSEVFYCDEPMQVVTIGEYRPYYTNGLPDPTPDEYDETCQVEVIGDVYDSQVRLECLLPIIKVDNPVNCIYNSKSCEVIGYDENKEYAVIVYDDELHVIKAEDVLLERDLYDLSYDELICLFDEIVLGSIFTSDYNNSFGVNPSELYEYGEYFFKYLYREYGKEWEDHDTAAEFADWICEQ